jgi:hypothetical protein
LVEAVEVAEPTAEAVEAVELSGRQALYCFLDLTQLLLEQVLLLLEVVMVTLQLMVETAVFQLF